MMVALFDRIVVVLATVFTGCPISPIAVFKKKKIQNYKLSFWHLHYDNKEILIFSMLVTEKFYVLKHIESHCLHAS